MSRIIGLPPAPSSTFECLVFPLKHLTQEFDTSFYHPSLTNDKASTEEINEIMKEICTSHLPFILQRNDILFRFNLFVCLTLLPMLGLLLFLAIHSHITAFICVPVYIVIFIVGATISRSKLRRITSESEAAVQKIIDKQIDSFTSRGLRWVLPVHFPAWIELHKDYLGNLGPDGQAIYVPPNMYQQSENNGGTSNV